MAFGVAGFACAAAPVFKPIAPNGPKPPAGAPNVLVVLTDDVGFSATSPFGGPVPVPALEALAAQGLRYNRFHTTAMCSPTRAALLTGRNHHAVGVGTVVDLATDDDGFRSIIPPSAASIGEVLKENGFATAWLGKVHVTPTWEITPNGPYDRWPIGLGFEYFYGFMEGSTHQTAPALIENTRFVEPPSEPGYFLDRDLADHALQWLRTLHTLTPQKPFLLYLAPGTAHSPHQAPQDWIARFRGRFDQGWDRVREATFLRQKQLGIIPADAKLTPRPDGLPAWETLSADQKKIAARMMEAHAAQLAYFDAQFARIVAELKDSGRFDNTLILFIQGDNGASGEGGLRGSLADTLNPDPTDDAFRLAHLDEIGGPKTYGNYPSAWAWAMNTPFQYVKQVASHLGGTRNGLVVSWPKGIRSRGEIRDQYAHVVDIAPTVYNAVGVRPPAVVKGVRQMPLAGSSLTASFDDAKAASGHRSQYYEMLGNRAFYEDGWLAATLPAWLPWQWHLGPAKLTPQQYEWALYDLRSDYSQADNVADRHPRKLAQLQRKFDFVARREHVAPITNVAFPRAAHALRPYVTNGRSHFEFHVSDTRLPDQSFPELLNRSWSMEVALTSSGRGDDGTLVTQGGWFGGWGLFLFEGRPRFVYKASLMPADLSEVNAPAPLAPGDHRVGVRVEAQPGRGAGATVTLLVDGAVVATGLLAKTLPSHIPDEGVGFGRDFGTPLSDAYRVPFAYGGVIRQVTLDVPEPVVPGPAAH